MLAERGSGVRRGLLQAIVICMGSREAKLRTEQHEEELDSRRQRLSRQSEGRTGPDSSPGFGLLLSYLFSAQTQIYLEVARNM